MNILVIAAHPDDEVLGCGGTIARHAAAGDAVTILILANGLDLLSGYAGIASLAQAGLWGVGAYASALLMMRAGWPFALSLLGAVGITLAAATLIGLLGLRLRRWAPIGSLSV